MLSKGSKMLYFEKHRQTEYQGKRVVNILTTTLLNKLKTEKIYTFEPYTLEEGESPEAVSYKMYGVPDYWWVILFVNNIVDPYNQWYRDSSTIEKYTQKKYGSLTGIHHFVNTNTGKKCDQYDNRKYMNDYTNNIALPLFIRPITYYEYEIEQNTKFRDIVVVTPRKISKFVNDFDRAMEDLK